MDFPRPLVSAAWLAEHLGSDDLAIIDCRMDSAAGDPNEGRRAHAQGHIPGSVHFHLDEDLSSPMGPHGGRHPLPEPAVIAFKLGAAGIGPGVHVVVADDSGAYAARAWWLLRWLGHDLVSVLDGGYAAWTAAGLPLTAEVSRPAPRSFIPHLRPAMAVSMAEVLGRSAYQVVVDARAPERFAGQPNPLDPAPGHIPGAVNRFWKESQNPDGTWRSPAELAERYRHLGPSDHLIHSCGSGVTACGNMLALAIAGLPEGRLYVGSWSDWTSYPENPVEK